MHKAGVGDLVGVMEVANQGFQLSMSTKTFLQSTHLTGYQSYPSSQPGGEPEVFQSQVQSQGWFDESQDPPTYLDEGGGQVVYTDKHRFEGCCGVHAKTVGPRAGNRPGNDGGR